MQKIAVMAAVQKAHGYHNGSNAYGDASNASPEYNGSSSTSKSGRFDADLHGNVNILLGGWVTTAPAGQMLRQHSSQNIGGRYLTANTPNLELFEKTHRHPSRTCFAPLILQQIVVRTSNRPLHVQDTTKVLNCLDSRWLKIQWLFRGTTWENQPIS